MVRVEDAAVWLCAEGGACSGCSGCGGRCGLIGVADDALRLPRERVDGDLAVGDAAILFLDEALLREEALRGYGWPLAGLLSGAALGWLLAAALGRDADVAVAVAATLGTLLGLRRSKRTPAPACRARPAAAPTG